MQAQTRVSTNGLPWGEREQRRFDFRVALFQRRGLTQARAEEHADRLFERDAERDDRRTCIECTHMQRDHGCFAARQGWMAAEGIARSMLAMPLMLQRCSQFDWVKP